MCGGDVSFFQIRPISDTILWGDENARMESGGPENAGSIMLSENLKLAAISL